MRDYRVRISGKSIGDFPSLPDAESKLEELARKHRPGDIATVIGNGTVKILKLDRIASDLGHLENVWTESA